MSKFAPQNLRILELIFSLKKLYGCVYLLFIHKSAKFQCSKMHIKGWSKLPHVGGQICPMDPINPFISVNHVPMEVDADVSKNVRKKKVFKMCFRTQITQKIHLKKIYFFSFLMKNLEMEVIFSPKNFHRKSKKNY